jgi:hypothetical protein
MNTRSAVLVSALMALGPIAACGDDDGVGDAGDDGGSSESVPTTTIGDSDAATTVPGADAELDVQYSHPEAGVEFSYGIECGESGAQVTGAIDQSGVDAATACGALTETAVVERLVDGPDHDVCTEIYGGPDVAEVTGTVGGEQVETTVDRADGCGINDWDEVLDPILPPAIGVEPGS